MKTLGAFVVELTAFISMCLMLAVLLGVPALWAVIGAIVLLDLGVILFLGNRPQEPDEPGGLAQLSLNPVYWP